MTSASIREFLVNTTVLARLALGVALAAGTANAASFVGLTMRDFEAIAVLHIFVMTLGFILFARIALHHSLSWRFPRANVRDRKIPRWLFWSAAASLAYVVAMFASMGRYGDGNAEVRDGREVWVRPDSTMVELPSGSVSAYARQELRLFSAGWLFFALGIAATSHVVEYRIRQLREYQRVAAA